MQSILAIVVNHRTPDLTLDCLRSLVVETRLNPRLRVVVVDNDSGDDSVTRLRTAIETEAWSWVQLLPLQHNGGFASGNNTVIRSALASSDPPDYLLLLNSDTIVRPGAIGALVTFLEGHPTVGLAGSRLEDLDGTPQCSAFRFPNIANELDGALHFGPVSRLLARWWIARPVAAAPQAADWLAGAALMIRRAVLETVGLLDEAYFLYYEDVDLCRRAQRAGWACWYVPASRVVHLVGRSSGLSAANGQRRPAYWFAARRRYFLKHHSPAYTLAADGAHLLGLTLRRCRQVLDRRAAGVPPRLLSDLLRHSVLGQRLKP